MKKQVTAAYLLVAAMWGAAAPQILPELGVKPVSSNNIVLLRAPSDFLTFRRPCLL